MTGASAAIDPVPILMYHAIGAGSSPGFARFTLDPVLFDRQLAYLAEQGYETVTVSRLVRARRGDGTLPAKPVALTFDDGFADFAEAALPALARYGFTATLYVVSSVVGDRARWLAPDSEAERPMLSWSQLAEVAAAGIEVGAHTRTHPELDRLSAEERTVEIARSRDELRDRLGVAVDSFAYPFGYYSRAVVGAVEAAGYASACAVDELVSSPDSSDLRLPRLSVDGGTDVDGLRRLLAVRPTRAGREVSRAKRLVWQSWRRRRHYARPDVGASGSVGA